MTRRRIQPHQAAKPLTDVLTWDIKEESVYSGGTQAEDYKAIHRNDNNTRLKIVSSGYHTATNEVFMETVKKLSETIGFPVHGYTEFGNGERVLAYLKNNTGMKVGDWDTNNYMVVGNSFDYSTGFFSGHTNEVLRCTNAFSRIKKNMSIRHNGQLLVRIDEMIKHFEAFRIDQQQLKRTFESWMPIKVNEEQKEKFVDIILGIDEDVKAGKEISSRKKNMKTDLFMSVNREIGDMGENLWSLFNGVTHYTTHVKPSSNRIFGNPMGSLNTLNQSAFDLAGKMALAI